MATTSLITPLHLSGNTTEGQNTQLMEFLGEAIQAAYNAAIERLDRNSAQSVLEMGKKVKADKKGGAKKAKKAKSPALAAPSEPPPAKD